MGRYFNNAGAPGEHVLDTRWGMVCLYGIFIAGETLNDPSLIDLSVYGPGDSNDNVTGRFMDCFKPNFLHEGALWGAGSFYRRSDIFPQCNDDRCRGDVAPRGKSVCLQGRGREAKF